MEHYFIGLSLASGTNAETGVAILDKNNEIILVDKLFSMADVRHFFDNFSSLQNSRICVSLPWENAMMNGKWRILSKPYQLVSSCNEMINTDNWTQRFSTRGADYFNTLIENGIKLNRFELYLTRQALKLESAFKERSPADCKALQSALKIKYGYSIIPTNMMPMSQLEAIVGAILARNISEHKVNMKSLFNFNGVEVIRG